jgi:hypothetical protein
MALGLTRVLMGVLGNGTAAGFEDGGLLADVAAGSEAESAHELGRLIGEDVAEDVACHNDFIILGILDKPHGGSVGVLFDRLDANCSYSLATWRKIFFIMPSVSG